MSKLFKIAAAVIAATVITFILTSGIGDEVKRSYGGKDIVEELYADAVKQNDQLKDIENSIEKFYKKKSDALEDYNHYTSYFNNYYAVAKQKTNGITDATAKQKATDLLSKSESAYRAKLTDWQNTIANLDAKEKELRDQQLLLKIMITEKMIASDQNKGLPNSSGAKQLSNDLQEVINKIKTITN